MSLLRRRTESRDGEYALSGINDPGTSIYQALTAMTDGGGGIAGDGMPVVNMNTAPRLSAVLRSVAIISNTIAALPLQVADKEPDGSLKPVYDDAEELLWGTPNPEATAITFWSTGLGHCVLGGNSFLSVDADGLYNPQQLWPIHPQRMRISRTAPDSNGRRHKAYQLDGDNEPMFDWREGGNIIHIPNLSLDGLRGLNPISYMRRTLQLAAAAEEYGAAVFGNGSLPGGVLETEADLTKDQHDKLLGYWERRHRGPTKAARIAIADNGAKWKPTSVTPEDAQFLDSRRFQVQEIARIFGVPPHLLYETTANTSWGSGLEEQTAGFIAFTLNHYSARFEQALTAQLLWRKPRRVARFDYEQLLRGKLIDQLQAGQIGIMNGIWSPDDVRRRLGQGARPDGLGGTYLQPTNLQPAGQPPSAPSSAPATRTAEEAAA